jgi:hypothetical protein
MRTIWRTLSVLALAAMAGCAGPTFTADTAPEYRVIHAQTKFYRLGPQQAGPPDALLALDERVRLLRGELGYSLALLGNGETGYIANEDLEPSPATQKPAFVPAPEPQHESAPTLPPVEPPLPKPDLDITPADAPAN